MSDSAAIGHLSDHEVAYLESMPKWSDVSGTDLALRFERLVIERDHTRRLLDDHHALEAWEGAIPGDPCPVCELAGVENTDPLVYTGARR